jgi:LysR family transcriptional regulator, glycine cleavage system transcriptional activator
MSRKLYLLHASKICDSSIVMLDDPGLSWSQLRAFEACARLSSFKAAALKLSISTSAVRFQISLLESRLGASLFERRGGRVALTEIGETFAAAITRPMHDLLLACATARQSAAEAPLTLTAPPLFARQFLLGEPFLKWCDANNVLLDVADNKRDLLVPRLIAAIRLATEDNPELTCTPLLNVELCIAGAPKIASSATAVDADWWAIQTLITPSASIDGWTTALRRLSIPDNCSPRILPYSSYSAALEAACAGKGLILAPLPFAETEIAAGRLVQISDIRIQSPTRFSVIMRNEIAASTRGRKLLRMLVRSCEV